MIFEGSMGLYLLVEKRFRGQRLCNVGLNIDENIQNRDGRCAMGQKAFRRFGRPHTLQNIFFSNRKEKKNYGKKYGEGIWPAGPDPYRKRKKRKDARWYYDAHVRNI